MLDVKIEAHKMQDVRYPQQEPLPPKEEKKKKKEKRSREMEGEDPRISAEAVEKRIMTSYVKKKKT